MSCKVTLRQSGNVAVVELSGRITLGEGSGVIRDTVKELVEKGERNVLLNLAEVTYIDSAGLGELVGSYATTTNRGGRLKLVHAQKRVSDVLQITKLYTVFEVFSDEATALRSFPALAASA